MFLLFTCTLFLDDNFLDVPVKLELFGELIHLIILKHVSSKIDLGDLAEDSCELCDESDTVL